MMTRILLAILLFTLAALPQTALAELPPQLSDDFAPLDGYVVMPTGENEFLIDLDASKGVRTGDLFSIIHKGEKITHPVSGEVIGRLDGSIAYLQVTRLKSGYSYARKVSGNSAVAKGDRIQRFNSVPARFIDQTGDSMELKGELQTTLFRLDWLAAESTVTPLLLFERSNNALTVKSIEGTSLFSYPLAEKALAQPAAEKSAALTAPVTVAAAAVATAPEGIIRNQTDTSKIWHGVEHKDEVIGLRIDDFNGDGVQEVALLLKDRLVISSYSGQKRSAVSEISLKGVTNFLAIDSLDLNGNGRPEIFLSAVNKMSQATRVYELEGEQLVEIARDLPMLVRRIEHPTEGALLLGQKRRNLKVPFSERPFRVEFAGDNYREGKAYPLPSPANIYGYTPFNTEDGSLHYAYLNDSDYLMVKTEAGDDIFESPDRYGGSETFIEIEPDASADGKPRYFLPARLLFRDGEILAAQNDGQRTTQNFRRYNKSRFVGLKWNGLSLDESWRSSDQSGHTADFAVADIDNDGQLELVLAIKFIRKGMFSSAKSALVVYEME